MRIVRVNQCTVRDMATARPVAQTIMETADSPPAKRKGIHSNMSKLHSHSQQKLALQGGHKAVGTIGGRGKPKIGVEEFMAVAERFGFSRQALKEIRNVVKSEDLGGGAFLANYYSGLKESKVKEFERVARESFGSKFAIGLSSGTAALHSAFVAAGVGPGTEVICPAIGFFATASAVVMARGVPVFCDVDESLSMDPKDIERHITPRTVALAPTCVMGSVPDMPAIMKVARKHKLKVIEDCAQSCGAKVRGQFVGTWGDFGCFSISAYKIVGGGEGGLLLTKTQRHWDRANCLAEGGGLWRTDRFAKPRYPGELFCGTNYRMSELEAAIDVVQLKKMPATVKRFNNVKRRIISRLRTFKEIRPQTLHDAGGEVGYTLRFFPESMALGQRIHDALRAEGIGCGMRGLDARADWHIYHDMFPLTEIKGAVPENCALRCPTYLEKGGKASYQRGDCPVADDLHARCISIGLNQWYTAADCRNVANGINKVLSAYCTPDDHAKPWF